MCGELFRDGQGLVKWMNQQRTAVVQVSYNYKLAQEGRNEAHKVGNIEKYSGGNFETNKKKISLAFFQLLFHFFLLVYSKTPPKHSLYLLSLPSYLSFSLGFTQIGSCSYYSGSNSTFESLLTLSVQLHTQALVFPQLHASGALGSADHSFFLKTLFLYFSGCWFICCDRAPA